MQRFSKPTTGITLKLTGHASKNLAGILTCIDEHQSNGGEVHREEIREDEGVYLEMNKGEGVYV